MIIYYESVVKLWFLIEFINYNLTSIHRFQEANAYIDNLRIRFGSFELATEKIQINPEMYHRYIDDMISGRAIGLDLVQNEVATNSEGSTKSSHNEKPMQDDNQQKKSHRSLKRNRTESILNTREVAKMSQRTGTSENTRNGSVKMSNSMITSNIINFYNNSNQNQNTKTSVGNSKGGKRGRPKKVDNPWSQAIKQLNNIHTTDQMNIQASHKELDALRKSIVDFQTTNKNLISQLNDAKQEMIKMKIDHASKVFVLNETHNKKAAENKAKVEEEMHKLQEAFNQKSNDLELATEQLKAERETVNDLEIKLEAASDQKSNVEQQLRKAHLKLEQAREILS